jgi:hypothetical protein
MSVTVFHRQTRKFPKQKFSDGNMSESQLDTDDSLFPMSNSKRITDGSIDEHLVFPNDYDQFVVRLEWSSPTNLIFFG